MNRLLSRFLVLLVPTIVLSACTWEELQTPIGNITGETAGSVKKYLGIPYAKPPIGSLRWKAPVAKGNLGNYDATRKRDGCPQGPGMTGVFFTSEDCLYLDIYTPKNISTPVPVMVFLHGGGYDIGSGGEPQYDGTRLAERGVIVVTVNYRLGILGHLALADLSAEGFDDDGVAHSGNYAFLDQIMALQWVQDNISAFGGDKDNVTLFGESAGAMSTCAHLASPRSQGLFHKAIIQSGSCEFRTRTLAAAETDGQNFAEDVMGCPPQDIWGSTLTCMRSKSAEQIIATIKAYDPNANVLSLKPILPLLAIDDNYFLTEPTQHANLIANSNTAIPVIIGINRNEGSMFHSFAVPSVQTTNQFHAKLDENYDEPELTTVKNLYPAANYTKAINAYADYDGDRVMACPARWTADTLADLGHNVYFYELGQETTSWMPGLTYVFSQGKGPDLGVFHSHDIAYVFGIPSVLGDAWHSAGRETMFMIQQFWVSFAKTGTPTSATAGALGGPVNWPLYDSTNRTYYSLKKAATASTQLKQAKCDFLEANKDTYFFDTY